MEFVTIKKALLPIAVMVVMALTLTTAGTAAYLTSTSSDVNLFALGKVDIALSETDTAKVDRSAEGVVKNEYAITKTNGAWDVISKDPKVTVAANSPDCWVFVTLGESENFGEYLSYQPADQDLVEGWQPLMADADTTGSSTQVTTASGAKVWYREVSKSDDKQVIHVLAGDAVRVNAGVTEAQVRALGTATNPTLTVWACAVQKAGLPTVNDAWALVGA